MLLGGHPFVPDAGDPAQARILPWLSTPPSVICGKVEDVLINLLTGDDQAADRCPRAVKPGVGSRCAPQSSLCSSLDYVVCVH